MLKRQNRRFSLSSTIGILLVCFIVYQTMALCGTWLGKGKKEGAVSERMQKELQKGCGYINVNGAWQRIIGMRKMKDIVRLRNGALLFSSPMLLKLEQEKRIIELDQFLKRQGIPFLFALAPQKYPLDDSLGYGDYPVFGYNMRGDRYVDLAKANGIDYIDFRIPYAVDAEAVDRNFFRTDFHWTFDAAFDAYCSLVPKLCALSGCPNTSHSPAEGFVRKALARFYCGSYGKRTGIGFSGRDENCGYYDLKSDAQISCSVPVRNIYRFGNFAEACCRPEVLRQPENILFDPFYERLRA